VRREENLLRENLPFRHEATENKQRFTCKEGPGSTMSKWSLGMEEEFQPGLIYELIYEAQDLARARRWFRRRPHLISFFKHDATDKTRSAPRRATRRATVRCRSASRSRAVFAAHALARVQRRHSGPHRL